MHIGILPIDDLYEKIYDIYTFGFDTQEMFKEAFREKVEKKLDLLFAQSRYVCVERSYVETEWKDLISLHYINTTYAHTLKTRVLRIHFFTEQTCSNKTYLGFITLRQIEEIQIALSYVFINWDVYKMNQKDDERKKVVSYKKRIHCMDKELYISTYPLLVQDSIVTCCVDVSLITLTRFLAHFGMATRLSVRDTCGEDFHSRYPKVLTESYFLDTCRKRKIPLKSVSIDIDDLKWKKELPVEKQTIPGMVTLLTWEGLADYINVYIDSNLPVLLFTIDHVVQIIGYVVRNGKVRHIIYDDSGYNDLKSQKEQTSFSGRCIYDIDLYEYICGIIYSPEDENTSKGDTIISLCIPTFARVYIDYPNYETFVRKRLKYLAKNSDAFDCLFDDNDLYSKNIKIKSSLMECSRLINHLNDNLAAIKRAGPEAAPVISDQESIVSQLEKTPMPHYVWYTEITVSPKNIIALCADPTRYFVTDNPEKVFFNGNNQTIWIYKSYFNI